MMKVAWLNKVSQIQSQIDTYRLKWLAPDKPVKYPFCFFGSWYGAPGY